MNRIFFLLLIGCFFVGTTVCPAVLITFDPGNYVGKYSVAGGARVMGVQAFDLADGNHVVDMGSAIGGSLVSITVDEGAGTVTSLNPVAASTSGATMTFNNVDIVIDPNAYTLPYLVTAFDAQQFTGEQTFTLVPSIDYILDNGTSRGVPAGGTLDSFLVFNVGATGDVGSTEPAAMTGVGNRGELNTTLVTIDPTTYGGGYQVGSMAGFSGVQELHLVTETLNFVGLGGIAETTIEVGVNSVTPASATLNIVEEDHDFLFSAVPEPTRGLLMMAGLTGVALMRHRRVS
ncbi:MAG: PEP-CTERM sorting domain-containing protein [Verrucomicrobiota bacterium]